ncbi:AAA family ATPase, partial [Dyella sp.]|uniref:AAA family ATPase n=1 Tax=Dyella sp. TaxID=1869338 RepID=UPI002D78A719
MTDTAHASTGTPLQHSFAQLREHLQQAIIGQPHLINCLLVALLADGHLLVEGAPGLAKTTAVKALAACIDADFHRVQFTPDLLPADLTGTDVFRPQSGSFEFERGPLFHNIVLADEINRAPPKTQAAMLEAMQEHKLTVLGKAFQLDQPFLVMATQNPVEQEGTYPLPEAQLDRFMFLVEVDYPDEDEEIRIARTTTGDALPELERLLGAK